MSKITKAIANDVAKKLVEKINKQINVVNTQIEDMIIAAYEATIPVEVMKLFKKYPEYIDTTKCVRPVGVGIDTYESYTNLRKQYPAYNNNSKVQLDTKQATEYTKLKNKKEKLEEKMNSTKEEIENMLLTLGTYKRVLAEMPELAKYLPSVSGSMGLMHVPQATRGKISCLISETDNKCIETL